MGGTFPAPLFLFLAGISLALVVDKLLQKGATPNHIAKKTIRRGAEILVLGLLFRFQEFAIAWGWAPWSDLFRVDILNMIGVSLMMMGSMCWGVLRLQSHAGGSDHTRSTVIDSRLRTGMVITSGLFAAAISLLTPLMWTTWRPKFLPWQLESYLDGVHNLGHPQGWLFPVFPWAAFAFAGLSTGFVLVSDAAKRLGARAFLLTGTVAALFMVAAKFFDSRRLQLYPVYDYWHTSPNFFLLRTGMLLLLLTLGYVWCRWGPGTWGFSPLIQLGQTSLLVYWVHIEFVYGRFTILPHRGNSTVTASAGLLIIFLSMLALSLLRTNVRGKFAGLELWKAARVRRSASA